MLIECFIEVVPCLMLRFLDRVDYNGVLAYLSWSRVMTGGHVLRNLVILVLGRFLMMSLASLAIFLITFTGVGRFCAVWLVMISVWKISHTKLMKSLPSWELYSLSL